MSENTQFGGSEDLKKGPRLWGNAIFFEFQGKTKKRKSETSLIFDDSEIFTIWDFYIPKRSP